MRWFDTTLAARSCARVGLIVPMLLLACRSESSDAGGRQESPSPAALTPLGETLIAGRRFNCQLRTSGEVDCWGGDYLRRIEPLVLEGEPVTSATQLAIGSTPQFFEAQREPVCALLRDGALVCDRAHPAMQAVRHVALGSETACAVLGDDEIACWRLHPKVSPVPVVTRYEVPGALVVAVGRTHACALTRHGRVECWGFDGCPPRHIPGFGVGVDISARVDTCVVDTGGVVRCLPPMTCPSPSTPLTSVSTIMGARQVAAGYEVNCATTGSRLGCWPSSEARAEQVPRLTEFIELSSSTLVRELAVGAQHACVRTAADTVECWGSNSDHQLDGSAHPTLIEAPHRVEGIDQVDQVEQVFVGRQQSCARLATGVVDCWGASQNPQSRLPWTGTPRPIPRLQGAAIFPDPMRGKLGFVSAELGLEYWPPESSYQLGPELREAIPRGAQVRVERTMLAGQAQLLCLISNARSPLCATFARPGATPDRAPQELRGVTDVALCLESAWVIEGAGKVASVVPFGDEFGNRISRVELPAPALDVACSSTEICALLEDGSVSCWSEPRFRQPLYAEAPTSIALAHPAAGLTMGLRSACTWTSEGLVECWGDPTAPSLAFASSRQLGTDPRTLEPITDAVQVAVEFTHGCLVHSLGRVSCWGANTEGQVGLSSGAWRSTPVEVPLARGGHTSTSPEG